MRPFGKPVVGYNVLKKIIIPTPTVKAGAKSIDHLWWEGTHLYSCAFTQQPDLKSDERDNVLPRSPDLVGT